MAPYVEGIRHYRVTDENHGAKVLAAAYIMMCQTILSVIARAGIKLSTARKWSWDDTAAAIASVFALGHTGAMAASYNYGMGQKMSAGGSQHWTSLEQSFYASNILYLSAVVSAKLSILLFIRRLTPNKAARDLCYYLAVLITLWGIISLLVSLFSCGLPTPWRYEADTCIDQSAFQRATGLLDMLTDTLLVLLPLHLFARLRNTSYARWTIITVFSLRGVILIPGILRFASTKSAFDLSPRGDASWNAVPYLTWTTVLVHYSVISASIPCVRPFLRSLESGLYDVSLRMHPRLTRASSSLHNNDNAAASAGEKNFALMTLSGWSVRKGVERLHTPPPASAIPITPPDNGDSSPDRLERQQSVSSEAEFARRLHPEVSEYRTRIQSLRTYPQFGRFVEPSGRRGGGGGRKSGDGDGNRCRRGGINVTREMRIQYERRGVVLQELQTTLE